MNNHILQKINEKQMKKRPDIKVGDTVNVHIKIKEGDKERIQIYKGIILAIKGTGLTKMFTVRKMSYGIGVEKIFPLHSPSITRIEIVKRGKVRRSKLYYMKRKIGKKAMRVTGVEDVYLTDQSDEIVKNEEEVEVASDSRE